MKRCDIKLLATSDMHGKLDGFRNAVLTERPDIVVLAGDVANRSKDEACKELAVETWAELLKFCLRAENANTKFVFVPGNHDEGSRRYARFLALVVDNFFYLDKHCESPIDVAGISFCGMTTYKGQVIGSGVDVCVFHKNPYKNDERKGRVPLRAKGASLVLFGHSHVSKCEWRESEGTVSLNVSNKSESGGEYLYHIIILHDVSGKWTVDKEHSRLNQFCRETAS